MQPHTHDISLPATRTHNIGFPALSHAQNWSYHQALHNNFGPIVKPYTRNQLPWPTSPTKLALPPIAFSYLIASPTLLAFRPTLTQNIGFPNQPTSHTTLTLPSSSRLVLANILTI